MRMLRVQIKRRARVTCAPAHGSPDNQGWVCGLQRLQNSISTRRRDVVKTLIVQSIRRLGGEIGVPSCARRPALLSVQVATHLQS